MQRKNLAKSTLLLLLTLLILLSLPVTLVRSIRSGAVTLLSYPLFADATPSELDHLRLENQRLREEVAYLSSIERNMKSLAELIKKLELLGMKPPSASVRRRIDQITALAHAQLEALPARVVYRSPSTWSSCLWIDRSDVLVNSPVVVGDHVIGVIDHVGQFRSRVRLITDSGLRPSVRVIRGEQLLAKGELFGSSLPLWRSYRNILTGYGFNFDFSDVEGEARDLRMGNILRPGDLLVTTGMDGVFPPMLNVARVEDIATLREGSYFYELTAIPTAGDLNELQTVFILPPREMDG